MQQLGINYTIQFTIANALQADTVKTFYFLPGILFL